MNKSSHVACQLRSLSMFRASLLTKKLGIFCQAELSWLSSVIMALEKTVFVGKGQNLPVKKVLSI